MLTLRHLVSLATIAIGLAALEWWSVNTLYGADRFAGPIMGVAFVAALAVLPHFMKRFNGNWYGAVVAALTALVELIFCVMILGSLSAAAVLVLPISVTSRFMGGDAATDFIVFLLLTLALVVAMRGWAKYSAQSLLASEAQLEAERARSQVAERDRELVRAELTLLRTQIEPHFLWNTLAHVQFLTRKSPEDAERMTGHLIRFLRSAVPKTQDNTTTLGTELESVDAYLSLMKIRMGSRLTVTVEMDESIGNLPFPPRLIHTLVENAIKHGIEPKVGAATLSVTAGRVTGNAQRFQVEVVDNGVGLQEQPSTQGTGLGLRSVRERLRLAYNGKAVLTVNGRVSGGVVASIEVPLEMAC